MQKNSLLWACTEAGSVNKLKVRYKNPGIIIGVHMNTLYALTPKNPLLNGLWDNEWAHYENSVYFQLLIMSFTITLSQKLWGRISFNIIMPGLVHSGLVWKAPHLNPLLGFQPRPIFSSYRVLHICWPILFPECICTIVLAHVSSLCRALNSLISSASVKLIFWLSSSLS